MIDQRRISAILNSEICGQAPPLHGQIQGTLPPQSPPVIRGTDERGAPGDSMVRPTGGEVMPLTEAAYSGASTIDETRERERRG